MQHHMTESRRKIREGGDSERETKEVSALRHLKRTVLPPYDGPPRIINTPHPESPAR